MSLLPVFPVPILKINCEIEDINLQETSDVVFEEKGFEKLRECALKCTGEYFYNVMRVTPETGIYITKSVINASDKNENSVLTGLIFLTDGEMTLYQDKRFIFDFMYTSLNEFNSSKYSFKLKKGDFVVFPSHLKYQTHGDTITWSTFPYNLVNTYLHVLPPKVFGKPPSDWEIIPK